MKTKWSFLWMTASTKGTKDKIFQIFQKKAQKAQKTSSKYLPNPQTKEIIQRIVTLYVTKYSLWKNWNPSKVIKGNFPIFGKSRWNIRVWQQSVRKVIWLKCIGLKLTANLEKSHFASIHAIQHLQTESSRFHDYLFARKSHGTTRKGI